MSAVNKAIILGNLGGDPETRSFQDGNKVCNFTVATSEKWTDKSSGEKRERTEWHRVAIFGPLADVAGKYLRKGSKVYLEGQLQTRKWQDQSGQDRFTTEIVLRGFGSQMVLLGDPSQRGESSGGQSDPTPDTGAGYSGGLDDEIPF